MSTVSPSVAALRAEFGDAIGAPRVSLRRHHRLREPASAATTCWRWLKDAPGQQFDYLTDVTAVDYRDPERPLEVV